MAQLMKFKKGEAFGGRGGAGVKKNASEYASSYGVLALTDTEVLNMMASLPVISDEEDAQNSCVDFNEVDWKKYGYKGTSVGGAMQMFNRIINVMEIPYHAQTAVAKDTKKTTRVLKQGINKDAEKTQIVANLVRVTRYADKFDPLMYSTTRAAKLGKVNKAHPGEPSPTHEDATEGLIACIETWLVDEASELNYEIVENLGLLPKMKELGVEFEEEK